MVPTHRPVGFADGAALFPVYGWDLSKSHSSQRLADVRNKVAAGINPAAKATLVTN